jgi:hypothetical protein
MGSPAPPRPSDIAAPNVPPIGAPAFPTTPGDPPATGQFWAGADYVLWYIRQNRLPPLVTSSAPAAGAILGPHTCVVVGNTPLPSQLQSGGRFLLGAWIDPAQTVGLELGALFVGSHTFNSVTGSTGAPGTPAIGRPFFDVLTNKENAQLVAFPGLLAGLVQVTASTRLQGGEGNGAWNLYRSPVARVDALFGFRYFELVEGLGIGENLQVLPTTPLVGGTAFRVSDEFHTNNRFYGGQFGVRGAYYWGSASLSVAGKLALGDVHQDVGINGSTLIVPAAGSGLAGGLQPGGLLALPTNIGRYQRDEFAFVPEFSINFGYWLTRSLRATVGYTLLYFTSVARPADQINRAVNPSLLPLNQPVAAGFGPAQPAFAFHDSDFWAQGINFGLEFRY